MLKFFALFITLMFSQMALAMDTVIDSGDSESILDLNYLEQISPDGSDEGEITFKRTPSKVLGSQGRCFRLFQNGQLQRRNQRCNDSDQCRDGNRNTVDLCVLE